MALPKIDVPTFDIELPSGPKIKYRPFLVKEEKILLMAATDDDEEDSSKAIQQVLQNCLIAPEDLDIKTLPTFDVEYYFLKIRSKSVAETVDLHYGCQNTVVDDNNEPKLCNTVMQFEVDLDKVKTVKDKKHSTTIKITKDVGIVMKYPKLDISSKGINDENIEGVLDLIVECMESIYDAEDVYDMKDTPKDETKNFILGLTQKQFDKIKEFFLTMPKLKYKTKVICTECEFENSVEVEGLQSFFG
jgi:hypothetical protein